MPKTKNTIFVLTSYFSVPFNTHENTTGLYAPKFSREMEFSGIECFNLEMKASTLPQGLSIF